MRQRTNFFTTTSHTYYKAQAPPIPNCTTRRSYSANTKI